MQRVFGNTVLLPKQQSLLCAPCIWLSYYPRRSSVRRSTGHSGRGTPAATPEAVEAVEAGQLDPNTVALGKAAARKARRTPPTIIPPDTAVGFSQLQSLLENGALLIDKPLEWTSFDVCGKLRGTLKPWKVKKVGHAGTLDPMASGLLVVCTGAGTKFVEDYQAMEKEYSGVLRLGEGTPSYDAETEVDELLPWEHVTDDDLNRVASQFLGNIMQVPPMYSAIKVKGQKLYDLARDGQTITREERPVTIMSLQLWRSQDAHGVAETSFPTGASVAETPSAPSARDALPGHEGSSVHEQPLSGSSYGCSSASAISSSTAAQASRPAPSGPASTSGSPRSDEDKGGRSFCQQSGTSVGPHRPHQDVFFRVRCSKGTYVRSLVYDVGRALGTVAYMASLRRDAIGGFHVRDAWQLPELVDKLRSARADAQRYDEPKQT